MRAAPLVLRDGDRDALTALARSKSVRADLAQRARMMVLAADGESNAQIARTVGVSRPTVILWRSRYEQFGMTRRRFLERLWQVIPESTCSEAEIHSLVNAYPHRRRGSSPIP